MTDHLTLMGRPVCGEKGVVRLTGGVDGSLVRGVDMCALPPGHEGPHSFVTVFPSSRLGRYQEAGPETESGDA